MLRRRVAHSKEWNEFLECLDDGPLKDPLFSFAIEGVLKGKEQEHRY